MDRKLPKINLKEVYIEKIYPTNEKSTKTREFILSWDENPERREYIKIIAKNDKCAVLNSFKEGDFVTVDFILHCHKRQNKDNETVYLQSNQLIYISHIE
jgi:hypothetical protein